MIKRYFLVGSSLLLTAFNNFSQDLALQSPFGSFSAPVSGCSLSSSEAVTVNIACLGSNLPAGTTFDVTYTINAGAPVTESVMLVSTLLASSVYTYTFTTNANLSVAGTYDIDATVTLTSVADINATNNVYSNYMVTSDAASVGGLVTGGTNVCYNSNSGNVNLTGQTGTVLNWEYSTDGGVTFINISNTTTSQSYSNLTVPTLYRAVVKNASCPSATSASATMTIDATSVGGTISGPTSGCISGNSGTLTLTGKTGNVTKWQYSTDGGVTFSDIVNTTTTQTYLNLTMTTIYRAVVTNGSCASANSGNRTITINPLSVGGTLASSDTVCASGNSGTLNLSGRTGSVNRWEYSTNGGVSWTNIASTSTSQTYTNLTTTTLYRVRVISGSGPGACAADYSDTATITVDAITNPGTLSSSATVCAGANSGTLNLAGNNGTILNWESSIDGGTTWSNIVNTTSSENYLNVTGQTLYRVQIQSGVCTADYSDTITIDVDSTSLGGNVASDATVCSGNNNGTLTVSGTRGNILNWEYSTDGGATWSNIVNTSMANNYTNLTQTTLYRLQTKNGVCTPNYSDTATITVDSVTVAGAVTTSTTVCSGSNSDTLDLSGQIGSVAEWQFSSDGGFTWLPIANVTTSQIYNNLSTTTLFRAKVQSGVCPASTSIPATITVDPVSVGGNIIGGTTVCASGNSGTLTLVGFTSSVNDWEMSTDGGATFTSLGNSTITQNYTNLSNTTIYHAIVGSGTCPDDTSTVTTISVDQPSVGGLVTLNDTVCAGANGDTLFLTGQTGTVVQWELSTDNGTTWFSLSNTDTMQIYNNLLTTSLFRVRVQNGVCAANNATAATITVNPQSDGGVVNSSMAGCESYNSGSMNLTGFVGSVVQWETSTDGGATWVIDPAPPTTTFSFSNLTDTTLIRAIVQSGACNVDSSSYATFTAYPKAITSFQSDTACLNTALSFVNTSTIPNGNIIFYSWDFGDGSGGLLPNVSHTYADTGNYSVSLVTTTNFGCLDTATSTARVEGLPNATIASSNGSSICAGDSSVLSGLVAANVTYLWSTGDTTIAISLDSSQTITLTVTDTITGCSDIASLTLTVNPAPIADAGIDTTINLGESYQLVGTGGGSYLWSPDTLVNFANIFNPLATPTSTTDFILVVTNSSGCSDSDTMTINVTNTINLVIPNLITPNGDGFNDVWEIDNLNLFPNNEVVIYNRAGQQVFKMATYDNTWGGTFNGALVPDGTYYYVLRFTDTDQTLKGSLNVLRNK